MFRKSFLKAIVCGYERGGTTLISQLLRQHPNLYSGFECGFLLVDKISDFLSFEPYCTMTKRGWQLTAEDLEYICQADNWVDVYIRLQARSALTKNKEDVCIFDKTPKYMQFLPQVLNKTVEVPCIVIARDPRAVLWSWAKRSNLSLDVWIEQHLEDSCQRYRSYAQGYKRAVDSGFGDRILLIQYESLCVNEADEVEKIFNFIGLEFDPAYLMFKESTKTFPNVYGNNISAHYLTEYEEHFPHAICDKILELTDSAIAILNLDFEFHQPTILNYI